MRTVLASADAIEAIASTSRAVTPKDWATVAGHLEPNLSSFQEETSSPRSLTMVLLCARMIESGNKKAIERAVQLLCSAKSTDAELQIHGGGGLDHEVNLGTGITLERLTVSRSPAARSRSSTCATGSTCRCCSRSIRSRPCARATCSRSRATARTCSPPAGSSENIVAVVVRSRCYT